tara:strand:+ start:17 stop:787 length:771 start_codon:yes stop_codon:yes gene_type:complete
MSLAAAYIFGRNQGVDPLQALKDLCVLAFNADTSGYLGTSYTPEVGSGNLVRTQTAQTTGIVGEALNVVNVSNNALQADSTLNSYSPLFFKNNDNTDKSYTLSYWVKISNLNQQYFFHNRLVTPRAGYFQLLNTGNVFQAVEQCVVGGSIKTLSTFFNINTTILPLNQWNHILIKFDGINNVHSLRINNNNITVSSISDDGYTNKNMGENLIVIGASNSIGTPLQGAIDAIHAFNGIIGIDQDDILYNNGNGVQLF